MSSQGHPEIPKIAPNGTPWTPKRNDFDLKIKKIIDFTALGGHNAQGKLRLPKLIKKDRIHIGKASTIWKQSQ